jgi:hypothetical protein
LVRTLPSHRYVGSRAIRRRIRQFYGRRPARKRDRIAAEAKLTKNWTFRLPEEATCPQRLYLKNYLRPSVDTLSVYCHRTEAMRCDWPSVSGTNWQNNIGSPLAVPTGGGYRMKGQTPQPRLHQRAHRSCVLVNATWMLAISGVSAYSQHAHNASQAASARPAWSELQHSMRSMHEALSSLKSTGALSAAQTATIPTLEAQLADRYNRNSTTRPEPPAFCG